MIHQKNMAARERGSFSLYIYIENFEMFFSETTGPILIYLSRDVPLVTLYLVCSNCHDLLKTLAARGRGLFSLYIYIKHFKNLFVRNNWTDLNITWQKCSLRDPLSRFSSIRHDVSKNMAARGQGYKIYTKILEQ